MRLTWDIMHWHSTLAPVLRMLYLRWYIISVHVKHIARATGARSTYLCLHDMCSKPRYCSMLAFIHVQHNSLRASMHALMRSELSTCIDACTNAQQHFLDTNHMLFIIVYVCVCVLYLFSMFHERTCGSENIKHGFRKPICFFDTWCTYNPAMFM